MRPGAFIMKINMPLKIFYSLSVDWEKKKLKKYSQFVQTLNFRVLEVYKKIVIIQTELIITWK